MLLLLIFTITFILGLFLLNKFDKIGLEIFGFGITVIGGTGLLILLIILTVNHATANNVINNYNTVKNTIAEARDNSNSVFERSALTTEILQINRSIASDKYYNEGILDIFIPDKVAELELLK